MAPTTELLAQNLRQATSRLSLWLDDLVPAGDSPRPATPQQMSGLLSELMQAGEWLRGLPRQKDPLLDQELGRYRQAVERLRDGLPLLRDVLVEERARLEGERARVRSAAEWARRSRQTL